jgi:hypothetical protein
MGKPYVPDYDDYRGALLLGFLLVIVGCGCIVAGIELGGAWGIVLGLSSLGWYTMAVVVWILRRILLCIEEFLD